MRFTLILFAFVMVMGCGSATKKISLMATDKVNLDEEGNGAPVDVAVFYLLDSVTFASAAFSDLWGDQSDVVLGKDKVSVDPYNFRPQETKTIVLPADARKKGIKFVGIAGRFREHDAPCWKKCVAVGSIKKELRITVTGSCIEAKMMQKPAKQRKNNSTYE